jgi:hypothetical protein
MGSRLIVRYWGRKPGDIINSYIMSEDSVIVDPFGGSGSIALTALEKGKRVIYADFNPYAWLVASVSIGGANYQEFMSAAYDIVDNASVSWISMPGSLTGDYLFYRGEPFLKRRNFDRVYRFFPLENRKKLRALLSFIDHAEVSEKTRLALYLAFCSSLFPASYMKRCNAGSWGVPCYWVPRKNCPVDALKVFERTVQRIGRFLKNGQFYSICFRTNCNAQAKVLLYDALSLKYRSNWTLITDPPHADEIQYGELSFFYWAWLKQSRFSELVQKLTGRTPLLQRAREIVVNEKRGKTMETYLDDMARFMEKTKIMKKKILILHEERREILEELIKLSQSIWGKIEVEKVEIPIQRKVGPKGSTEYILVKSTTI